MSGYFVPFLLDFSVMSNEQQADAMLAAARKSIAAGRKGAAIVYSANYFQTQDIRKAYEAGKWITRIGGANQAAVMMALEEKLGGDDAELQGHMLIAPITTMSYPPGSDQLDIVRQDLAAIAELLDGGYDVLGWQNQSSVGTDRPYAVGGGVAGSLKQDISDEIQNTLAGFAMNYAQP